MRRLVEFTGANITGVTICQHQVNRANARRGVCHLREYSFTGVSQAITATRPQYIQDRTTYLVGDYNDLPEVLEPSTLDAAYFMESLSHAEDRAIPLAQAAKIARGRRRVLDARRGEAERPWRLRDARRGERGRGPSGNRRKTRP